MQFLGLEPFDIPYMYVVRKLPSLYLGISADGKSNIPGMGGSHARASYSIHALTISAKMHPRLHTSTALEYDLVPRRISGALYQRVTTSWV